MKRTVCTLAVILATSRLFAQGTMLVDQQSFDLASAIAGTSIAGIGQSFTPTLLAIDYVQLGVYDTVSGSMLFVNLRQDSMSGPIIGTTDTQPVTTGDPHIPATFLFPSAVTLLSGTKYFLEPVIVADAFQIGILTSSPFGPNPYSGGSALHGNAAGNYSLWFSEGIIVPEPPTWAISGLGLVMLLGAKARRMRAPMAAATSGASTPKPARRCSRI